MDMENCRYVRKAHQHFPIAWIAEKYRQEFLEQMRTLWDKKLENQRHLNRETSKITSWEDFEDQFLRKMYEELETMCRQPDLELLQHFEDLMKKSNFLQQHMPQPVIPLLSSMPIDGLIRKFCCYQVYMCLDYEEGTCHFPI
ncbi:PREDICTED: tripartite motif-containing protein 49-like [Elephantulus edwardii]|uniref:tripartite motif-containing protein 49-like n=1 Tax=Elephantulus edwardii TaxID=28737 RepID=UPI0003F07DBB|nr:PREDICTED: tripartite motif-containing protein 49-like [Elephantulus edwardii]